MTDIDALLAHRQTRRLGSGGDPDTARKRLRHSQFIASHYPAFDRLRRHLVHPEHHRPPEQNLQLEIVTEYLARLGWIERQGRDGWYIPNASGLRSYLNGGWLEELVFCAYQEAGVDEACYAQKVEWVVDGITGRNEIDVIGRRGELLSFASCKAIGAIIGELPLDKARHFLTEADYWNIHFANDCGRAMLVISADLVDELRGNSHRYPSLLARASILEVTLAGLEQLRWDKLVDAVRSHW